MHEVALAGSMLGIVEQAARSEGLARVSAIRVSIGRLSCVMPDALRFCFESVTRGTVAEGARLDIDEVNGAGRCPRCERGVAMDEPYGVCPDCGVPLVVTAGREMRVMEVEGA